MDVVKLWAGKTRLCYSDTLVFMIPQQNILLGTVQTQRCTLAVAIPFGLGKLFVLCSAVAS